MHLVIGARGIRQQMRMWEEMMSAQFFNHKIKLPDGKEQDVAVQLAVRPIMLYELVFPKEHLNEVLNIVCPQGPIDPYAKKYKIAEALKFPLRKALGLKKLPKWEKKENTTRAIPPMWVSTHPIGIKEDLIYDGVEQL